MSTPNAEQMIHDPTQPEGIVGVNAAALLASSGERAPFAALADDPQFAQAGRVHDWRNYVPEEVRAVWAYLPPIARAVAFICAQAGASAEEWD